LGNKNVKKLSLIFSLFLDLKADHTGHGGNQQEEKAASSDGHKPAVCGTHTLSYRIHTACFYHQNHTHVVATSAEKKNAGTDKKG
jgi:hypothetical protein